MSLCRPRGSSLSAQVTSDFASVAQRHVPLLFARFVAVLGKPATARLGLGSVEEAVDEMHSLLDEIALQQPLATELQAANSWVRDAIIVLRSTVGDFRPPLRRMLGVEAQSQLDLLRRRAAADDTPLAQIDRRYADERHAADMELRRRKLAALPPVLVVTRPLAAAAGFGGAGLQGGGSVGRGGGQGAPPMAATTTMATFAAPRRRGARVPGARPAGCDVCGGLDHYQRSCPLLQGAASGSQRARSRSPSRQPPPPPAAGPAGQ